MTVPLSYTELCPDKYLISEISFSQSQATDRGSRSQMFFKIDVLQNCFNIYRNRKIPVLEPLFNKLY